MKFLEDWSQFYPLDKCNPIMSDSSVVEVIVGGVKMKYPSCYVLVTDMDESITETTPTPPAPPITNGVVKNGSSMWFFIPINFE